MQEFTPNQPVQATRGQALTPQVIQQTPQQNPITPFLQSIAGGTPGAAAGASTGQPTQQETAPPDPVQTQTSTETRGAQPQPGEQQQPADSGLRNAADTFNFLTQAGVLAFNPQYAHILPLLQNMLRNLTPDTSGGDPNAADGGQQTSAGGESQEGATVNAGQQPPAPAPPPVLDPNAAPTASSVASPVDPALNPVQTAANNTLQNPNSNAAFLQQLGVDI